MAKGGILKGYQTLATAHIPTSLIFLGTPARTPDYLTKQLYRYDVRLELSHHPTCRRSAGLTAVTTAKMLRKHEQLDEIGYPTAGAHQVGEPDKAQQSAFRSRLDLVEVVVRCAVAPPGSRRSSSARASAPASIRKQSPAWPFSCPSCVRHGPEATLSSAWMRICST